jgi:hypothetical protein
MTPTEALEIIDRFIRKSSMSNDQADELDAAIFTIDKYIKYNENEIKLPDNHDFYLEH